jgi:hypothetical protein
VIRDVRLSGEELAKRLGLARDVVLIARLQPAGRVLEGLKELLGSSSRRASSPVPSSVLVWVAGSSPGQAPDVTVGEVWGRTVAA